MRALTTDQIQRLDRLAIERYGVPSLILMENAGRAVAEAVLRGVEGRSRPAVFICCGSGNNAGDGLVAARHLWNKGISPRVSLIGPAKDLKADALTNYSILKRSKYPVYENVTKMLARRWLKETDIVVDALFGVGLNRDIQDPFRSMIELINAAAGKKICVDVPSGLDAATGKIYGVCVKADETVTFSFAKKGFFQNHGPRYAGKITVADIGIPKKIFKEMNNVRST